MNMDKNANEGVKRKERSDHKDLILAIVVRRIVECISCFVLSNQIR